MSAGGDNKGNREQEISTISRSLKALAKELNVCTRCNFNSKLVWFITITIHMPGLVSRCPFEHSDIHFFEIIKNSGKLTASCPK